MKSQDSVTFQNNFLSKQQSAIILQNQQKQEEIKYQVRRDTFKGEKKFLLLRKYIKQILKKKQNIEFEEGLSNLKKNNMKEGFCEDTFVSSHQCFSYFNAALQNSRSLRFLDISGMDIDPLLAIELGQSIQKNSSLYEINLSGCNLSTSSLQYIFSSISNHQTLQSINLFNNQGFSNDLVNDISQFLFKGKNNLKKLKLTHCNIPSTAISLLLRNLKYSNSINSLDISMMDFTTDALTSLGIALQHYKGPKVLQQLNISYSNIKNKGMAVLAQRVSWSFRKINLKELNLSRNFITQQGVSHLERFLKLINQLQRLDLSLNQIEEFNCLDLMKRPLYEINLCSNLFSNFPEYFFVNTLVVNLSNNNIQQKGAFKLSSILRQNPMWMELNLSNNQLCSEGFNFIIFGLRDNTMLKKLIVRKNNLDGEAIITYMINHEQVNFESLDISFNCIRYMLIYYMLNFIKGGRLKSLKCNNLLFPSNCDIIDHQIRLDDNNENNFHLNQDQENFKYLQFQLSSFNLREIDFSNNSYIFSPVVNSLAQHFNKIEILNLSSCKPITDQDLDKLSLFIEKSSMLHDLNLSNLAIGYRAFESMNRLRKAILISNIKSLNMSSNQLFKSIKYKVDSCETIFNYKLESIDYSHNGIEATHVYYIEAILFSYKNLKELNLSYNSIDFVGLIAIMKYINQNIPLQKLNLSNQNLRADDLLIISHFLGNEYQNLNYLNLANNNSIKRVKIFFNLCSSQKLHSLSLSQIFFDQPNIQKTREIIQKQKKNISEVTVDYCNFTQNGYLNLVSELIKCKKLSSFSINYNPFIHIDLYKSAEFLFQMKNLKALKFSHITLIGNASVSEWLQNQDLCSIHTINVSQSTFQQEWIDDIMQSVEKNTSLKHLLLNNCGLGRLNLTKFWRAIAINESLKVVSLEQNHLTYHLEQFVTAFQQAPKQTYLSEINLSNNFITPTSFAHLITSSSPLIIRQINLTQCFLSQNHFSNLEPFFNQIDNDFTLLQNIQSLTLAENKLCDKVSSNLAKLLSYMTCIEELNLSQNLFTSNGSIEILRSILCKESFNCLNLSQNKIDDLLANFILELNQDFKIKFLILRQNAFSVDGYKKLVKILHKYETLFIDNIWKQIDDRDSAIILNQYAKVSQRYRLKQELLPSFLKEINLQNSSLTDKFCEILGKYFPLLQFIEIIDISDNPFITMYGKTCLFFILFDISYEQHKLKVMNITDSQEIRKFYDDGLLRYIILRFRNFLLPYNTTQEIQQINGINQTERVKKFFGGMFGSFLLHKINKLLFYLDLIEPPTFIVSTLFIQKFRRNNFNIKLLMTLFWFVFMFIFQMQYRNMTFVNKNNLKSCLLEQVLKGECTIPIPNTLSDVKFSVLCLTFITFSDLLQLLITVKMRQKIHPALQLVHPSILDNLHSKFPTKQEILLMLFSIFTKFCTIPERIFLPQLLFIDGSIDYIQNYQIIFSILIIGRGLDQLIVSLINFINFIKANPRNDQAKYLSLLQQNLYDMNYYVPSQILSSFCPIQGYQVSNPIKINFQIIIEAFRMIIFEIPLFVMVLRFCDKPEVQHSLFDFNTSIGFKFLLSVLFYKSLISIIISTIKILTSRPSVVKQHRFNQAFSIKQFIKSKSQFVKPQDLKVEETIKQLIQESYTKRVQILNNIKELEPKNSFDQIISENDEKNSTPQKEDISSNSSLTELDSPQSPFKLEQPKFKQNR